MQKEQEMGGGVVETYNERSETEIGHTERIGEDDARQDLLHVNSRVVSKQPYIIEIMNQREQARWRTGSLPALQFSRFSARGSVASPCGSSHGPLLATKCNKSDNSTWQMPAQKMMENNRWEGTVFTDLHSLWTASGIWRRDTSSKQYELHLESRRRAESSGNTGNRRATRGTDM